MGAEMFIAVAAAPHFVKTEHAIAATITPEVLAQIGRSRIGALTDDALNRVLENVTLDLAGNADLVDERSIMADGWDALEATESMRVRVRASLNDFHAAPRDGYPRDTTRLTIDGRPYLASGGLSWGDIPTDSYEVILLTDELALWETPIDAAEIVGALNHLAHSVA